MIIGTCVACVKACVEACVFVLSAAVCVAAFGATGVAADGVDRGSMYFPLF